jgi:uncharacterized protein (TIGR02145 family)
LKTIKIANHKILIAMKIVRKISIFLLLFTSILLIITSCKKNDENDTTVIKDGDGNVYTTVTIGTQTWLVENLKTTKYNDGTPIPIVPEMSDWNNLSTTPGYCWHSNDESTNKNLYGALYNWFTVNSNKLCPIGWHVPSDSEWKSLSAFLGGEGVAGSKMKSTSGWAQSGNGSNESGFNALPGGYRGTGGNFEGLTEKSAWWSSTSASNDNAYYSEISFGTGGIAHTDFFKRLGLSVRCIKN